MRCGTMRRQRSILLRNKPGRAEDRHLTNIQRKRYRRELGQFTRYLLDKNIRPELPHDPGAIAYYLLDSGIGDNGQVHGMRRAVQAIADSHRRGGHADPTTDPLVVGAMRLLTSLQQAPEPVVGPVKANGAATPTEVTS